jgi:hypothetical protein
MKPMMALSMTFASPVAMKPLLAMAFRIGSRQRPPMSASLGNQSRNGARSLGTIFWPVKKLKGVLPVDGRQEVRQDVMEELAARDDLGS